MSSRQAPRDVPPDVLAERYGRRSRTGAPWYRRPLPLAAAVLAGLLVLAYGAWVSVAQSRGPAFSEISHRVVDDRSALVRFSVTREPGTDVQCTVRALDADGAEVGVLQVPVPATPERDVQQEVEVTTTQRAVTAGVASCSAVEG
ncbi:DUF4307 domain-containing protein [Kineococcus sp. SYSU DK006]|uniref:DUF4307 domain-containing protein n=1 Tax=Kineococcus sp. SYSU DK006 TaxID=3383127 RepID=UPI003D7CED47